VALVVEAAVEAERGEAHVGGGEPAAGVADAHAVEVLGRGAAVAPAEDAREVRRVDAGLGGQLVGGDGAAVVRLEVVDGALEPRG
jgi:hypothetical protein